MKGIWIALGIVVALVLGYLVWPTPFSYTKVTGPYGEALVRLNRFTNRAQVVAQFVPPQATKGAVPTSGTGR